MKARSIHPRMLFAASPGCTKAETLLICNHLVNQYGVDNLEIGSIISWAMELYEKGILTSKDTDGIDLRFGNDEALIEMIHHICKRDTWLGDVLAEGGLRAAEKIGKDSIKYMIHVKGMNHLGSDERATPGLALNAAMASRGSDHLRSRAAIDLYHLPEQVLRKIYGSPVPYDGPLSSDQREYVGKGLDGFLAGDLLHGRRLSRNVQVPYDIPGGNIAQFRRLVKGALLQHRT